MQSTFFMQETYLGTLDERRVVASAVAKGHRRRHLACSSVRVVPELTKDLIDWEIQYACGSDPRLENFSRGGCLTI